VSSRQQVPRREAEITNHLGYEKNTVTRETIRNSHPKSLKTRQGLVEIAVLRDRNGEFPRPKSSSTQNNHLNLLETEESPDIVDPALKHPSQSTAHLLGCFAERI